MVKKNIKNFKEHQLKNAKPNNFPLSVVFRVTLHTRAYVKFTQTHELSIFSLYAIIKSLNFLITKNKANALFQ